MWSNWRVVRTIPLTFIVVFLCPLAAGKVIYVDADATGANDGSAWVNAYNHLQDALADANSGEKPVEIWVARGTYAPDSNLAVPDGTGDREATFQLINGVALYGGFPVGGGAWQDRDPSVYQTILSGDLNGNDGPSFAKNGENSYHVITGTGTNATAVLDGFTITAGNANAPGPYDVGGGMYNESGSPVVSNCAFSHNWAMWVGGGMYNSESNPTLTNCTFNGNATDVHGGGMGNSWYSSPTLTNCTFEDNSAGEGDGGAIFNFAYSSPTLTNCAFSGNVAGDNGGGMDNRETSSPTLTNCTFSGNVAGDSGGAMSNGVYSRPTVTNCILWGNTASNGSQIHNGDMSSATVRFSDVQQGYDGTGNINADPLFVAPDSNNFRLLPDSPCIDAGDPRFVPEPGQTDIDGDPRTYAGSIDMGAYEYNGYVKPIANAGPDQHVAGVQLITLDASGSFIYDPCSVVIYEWDQLMGPAVQLDNSASVHPTFTPQFEGEYEFKLVIVDGEHRSQPDKVLIVVGNQIPVADAGPNVILDFRGIANLDGTDSYDPDAIDKLSYTWRQLEGPEVVLENPTTATPFFYCGEKRVYVFELVVSDGFVNSEPSIVQVTIATTNIRRLTVAAVTMHGQPDTTANIERFHSYMNEAYRRGAKLIVFPECALQGGYALGVAETIPGPSTEKVVEMARQFNMAVVFGMIEKGLEGELYNASVFLGPNGIFKSYRKRNLEGTDPFTPGSESGLVRSPLGKVGLLICADVTADFPFELAAEGADFLVTAAAWGGSGNSAVEIAAWTGLWHIVANAIRNSLIIDPNGVIVADTGPAEGMVVFRTDIPLDLATRADFYWDDIVDLKDFCRLAQYWGQAESSVDIGPAPLGDGVVDYKDLLALVEWWLMDFRLIAHWKLDETEGFIAHDSIRGRDATLEGEPLWQPDGGMIRGALDFDGANDYVSTPFVLDPTDGEFSVFAWAKGGEPGQVIISQADTADWLLADAPEGKLRTELGFGRYLWLSSDTVITDGDWHGVGLTWDGHSRILYVDDKRVAGDSRSSPVGSELGLYIGCGKDKASGSFFFGGRIDDVRIYNHALTAEEIEELVH